MNYKLIPTIFVLSAMFVFVLTACSSEEKIEYEPKSEPEIVVEQHEVTSDFTAELTNIMMAYQMLYEAILQKDQRVINNAVDEFRTKIYAVEPEGMYESAVREWLNLVSIMSEEAQAMKDEPVQIAIEAHLYAITDIFTTTLERYSNTDITIYRFFCEDAFSGSGAAWLSINSEVKNPYQSDASINCGEIETVFEAR